MGFNQSDCVDCPSYLHVISPPSNLRMQNKALFTALCVALFAAAIAVPVNLDLQTKEEFAVKAATGSGRRPVVHGEPHEGPTVEDLQEDLQTKEEFAVKAATGSGRRPVVHGEHTHEGPTVPVPVNE